MVDPRMTKRNRLAARKSRVRKAGYRAKTDIFLHVAGDREPQPSLCFATQASKPPSPASFVRRGNSAAMAPYAVSIEILDESYCLDLIAAHFKVHIPLSSGTARQQWMVLYHDSPPPVSSPQLMACHVHWRALASQGPLSGLRENWRVLLYADVCVASWAAAECFGCIIDGQIK